MSKVYNYVLGEIEDGKSGEDILNGLAEFYNGSLYEESNIGFYFYEESHEITQEADGYRGVILEIEKDETIEQIKESFLHEAKKAIYNVYKDEYGSPVLEIDFDELNEKTNILSYIFDEYLKADIECFLEQNNSDSCL